HPRIHVLINNAGIITRRRELTPDGLETQFAVNHLGPFLLTALLLDALRASAPSRVITVSSGAHAGARLDFDDLMGERRYDPTGAYSRSKLANILFTRELARRLAGSGVTANCLHPGVIATRLLSDYMGAPIGLAARLFGGSPGKGAETIVYLAASPDVAGTTAEYFERRKAVRPAAAAYDTDSARRLWEVSERLTAVST
nr:SDR family NAD(P)-dependent oxidoreductase [Gemmatimonadales bacterium]